MIKVCAPCRLGKHVETGGLPQPQILRAGSFFYVCAGVLMLTVAGFLRTDIAEGQMP